MDDGGSETESDRVEFHVSMSSWLETGYAHDPTSSVRAATSHTIHASRADAVERWMVETEHDGTPGCLSAFRRSVVSSVDVPRRMYGSIHRWVSDRAAMLCGREGIGTVRLADAFLCGRLGDEAWSHLWRMTAIMMDADTAETVSSASAVSSACCLVERWDPWRSGEMRGIREFASDVLRIRGADGSIEDVRERIDFREFRRMAESVFRTPTASMRRKPGASTSE